MAVNPDPARLGLASLDRLPERYRPRVRPDQLRTGIVHLGLGAFHRAHQAVFTEDAIATAGGDWGTAAVAPQFRSVLDPLAEQDGLYSVLSLDGQRTDPRVVGVLTELYFAPEDPLAVVRRLADPQVRIVTLTVSEKGYRIDPATGGLRLDPEVRADLGTDRPPTTVPGLVARGLLARMRADAGPIAVVSCDNLPSNGTLLSRVIHDAVTLAGEPNALDWLKGQVTFPETMVDRIVPASTPETFDRARDAVGLVDLAAIGTEPFRQWVIQDDFPAGRPAWDRVGAVLTDDVGPWERMKLRALNGVHSALAYLGALAGAETIDEALRLPDAEAFLGRFIAEDVAPTLTPPPGQGIIEYGRSVLSRFANPTLGHRTLQVAMDGTQKLPQRLLGTIIDRRRAGARPALAALVLAAWMRFVRGYADDGRALPLDDPLADSLRKAVAGAPDTPEALADALFARAEVFPAELAGDDVVRALVVDWLRELDRHAVAGALRRAGGAG